MGTVNRGLALVAAIAVALTGWLIAPASAEELTPYSVTFVRDANCANTGTFIIRGIPGSQRLLFAAGWGPRTGPPYSPVYGGFEYKGKAGSSPTVWRKHLAGPKVFYGKMPAKPFLLTGMFRTSWVSRINQFDILVPACTR